jgi:hypothetical protein
MIGYIARATVENRMEIFEEYLNKRSKTLLSL